MIRPPPEHVEALRAAAEAIVAAPGIGMWHQPLYARRKARAFVWALYAGEPTLEAQARVCYGADWDARRRSGGEAAFQAWLRLEVHGFVDYERAVARLNLIIPASGGGAARAAA